MQKFGQGTRRVSQVEMALVHPFFKSKGGAERKILLLAQFLREKNVDVTIYTFSWDTSNCFKEYMGGLKVKLIPYGKNSILRLKSIIKLGLSIKEKLIYSSNYPANIVSAISKIKSKKRIIYMLNEPLLYLDSTRKRENIFKLNIAKIIDKISTNCANKILTNSKNTANAVAKIYSVHPEVIYSGIDTGKYFPKNNKSKFFFTIGRIKKEKNFEFLIEIMNSLKDMKTKIIIAGEGDYLDKLRKKSKSSNIVFVGKLTENEKLEMLRNCKLFVFPTKNEPLGVTPMEAMACGKKVLAFRSGGVKETVSEETGYLCDSDLEFKKKFMKLINTKLKNEFQECHLRVKNMFSLSNMLEKNLEVINHESRYCR